MNMKIITTLLILGVVVSHVTSARLEQHVDEEDDFGLFLDEQAMDDVLTASWFSKAISDASRWTKKAANDVAGAVKSGCGVVNSLPLNDLMKLREKALLDRGVSEDQAAALYGGYQALKGACQHLG
ncbi:uncharacterized protein LOC121430399 [Lytechinus variegatus]|uniref:uncharacterized protein LOC121430399 n=1 Tax=Lytechinus variegatus TaxID=7654 RepID=UPI001BB1E04A|nr:uncharacterized protein LOC121430399 [Lytechinus variegatus]